MGVCNNTDASDRVGRLHGLAQPTGGERRLLLSRAHNVVARGRSRHTPGLRTDCLARSGQSASAARYPAVKKALDKVRRAWVALDKQQTSNYAVHEAFPEDLLAALQLCGNTLTDHLAEHPAEPDAALQAFYFDALQLAVSYTPLTLPNNFRV